MLTLHVKLENEYFKLNDYIEDGNITWGKNGDDGVSVTLKNVPNGKNLLADSLGRELVAYRDGELAWKGFVSNVTENENGIELIGRGDFHRLDYIEDYGEFFSKTGFEDWIAASPENIHYYKQPPEIANKLRLTCLTVDPTSNVINNWYDSSGVTTHTFTASVDPPKLEFKNDVVPNIRKNYPILEFEENDTLINSTFTSSSVSETIQIVFDTSIFNLGYSNVDLLTFGNYPSVNGYKISIDSTNNRFVIAFRSGSTVQIPISYDVGDNGVTTLTLVFNATNNLKVYGGRTVLYNASVTKGTAPTAGAVIGSVAAGNDPIRVLDILVYNQELSDDQVFALYDYYVERYTFSSFIPSNNDVVVTSPGQKIVKGEIEFQNNCYIDIPNGSSFTINQAVVATYKVPLSSNAGVEFGFFDISSNLPTGFSARIEFYNKENVLIDVEDIGAIYTLAYGASFGRQAYTINIALILDYAYSFTNTASDGTYFLNIKRVRLQSLNPDYIQKIFPSIDSLYPEDKYIEILNDVIFSENAEIYTTKSNYIVQGQIMNYGAIVTDQYTVIKDVKDSTYNGNPATLIIADIYDNLTAGDIFYIKGLTTGQVINKVLTDIYGTSVDRFVKDPFDDLGNAVYGLTKPIDIINTLAENIDYKWFVTGGKFYFTKNPAQTYYLMQSSKNISQSFDNVYTRIRTKFKSVYDIENFSQYAAPPNKYSVVKSKAVEQGTLSSTLADLIAETVANENVRNVVKVIPQTGELYNEYGAVVRDPKINSSVVLKNVVPELIGLGDKTYYLSEITYNFATGEYEYVIDEPELTFELILSRTQNS